MHQRSHLYQHLRQLEAEVHYDQKWPELGQQTSY